MTGKNFTLKRYSIFVFILFAAIIIPVNIINAVFLDFTQHYVYNEGTNYRARAVAAADIDEDGDTDVIVGDSYYDDLIWYKNNGSETFSRVVIDSTYDRAAQLEIFDLDEDGDLDIIGGDNDAYQIKWWENDGAENFTEQVVSSYGSDFTIHDIDDDGDYDFVAPDWDSGLYWVENDGSEVFTNRLIDATYTAAWTTCAGDMNGDTTEDIIVSRYNSNLYFLANDGSESFTENIIDTGSTTKTLACVNLDGDSDLDIVAAHSYGGDIIWFDNNGSGTFTEKTVVSGSYGSDDFKVIDLDADGDMDIVTADDTNNKVLWFDNNGSETFTERTVDTYYDGVTTVDVADIDGDTDLDVVAGSYENGQDVMWFDAALDAINPGISTLSPANDSTGADTTSNLVITFDEAVDAETGFIKLYKEVGDELIQSFNVTSDISGTGTTTITANPTSDLDEQTEYYIQIDATAFDDPTGNSFAGIADETSWDFTTADETNPSISTLSPANDATGIAVDSNLVITFTEAINVETGNVVLYKAGHQEIESIGITSGQVTGDGTDTITINPSSDLQELYVYYLYIDATAIDDLNGNSFAGIAADTTWTFTTAGTAGVITSSASGNTNEAGATATFTVVLNTEPTADVTIPVSSSDVGEGTVSSSTLTFTAGDWYIPQTVTVTGVNDDLDDGNQAYDAVLSLTTSSDGNYNGLNPSDASLTNEDNDTFGITKSETSLALAEGGSETIFTLVLNTEPTADVLINVFNTTNNITTTGNTTFTSANWDTPRNISVTPIDDDIAEGDHTDSITFTATSSDSNYNNTAITNVNVSLTDNDTAGITTTGINATLTEGEDTTYTLVLDSEPIDDVIISLSSANSEVAPTSSVTFTSANWDTTQTITLTATDDTDYEGDHSDTITHSVTSDDSNYNSYSLTDLTISITDNDEEPIEETPEEEEAEEEPESPDENNDEEEIVPENKEEVGEIENNLKGEGQVTIYEQDNETVRCNINAWPVGGAVGTFMQTLDQDQVAVVKNRYGTTIHVYDLNCNLVDKKRLSPKIHPRQMVVRNFIGNSNSQEIVIGSRRGSTLYLKAFRYNQNKDEWYLLREKSFRPVPSNYTLEKTSKGYVQVKNSAGKVLHTWKMKKTSTNDTKIVI